MAVKKRVKFFLECDSRFVDIISRLDGKSEKKE